MCRPGHARLPRYLHTVLGVALLTGLASAPLPAQQASSSCGLLQVAELEAAIGGKAAAKPYGAKQARRVIYVDGELRLLGPN